MLRRLVLILIAAATLGIAAPVAAQAYYDGGYYHRGYAYDYDEPGWGPFWWHRHHHHFFHHYGYRHWWGGPGYGYYRSW